MNIQLEREREREREREIFEGMWRVYVSDTRESANIPHATTFGSAGAGLPGSEGRPFPEDGRARGTIVATPFSNLIPREAYS